MEEEKSKLRISEASYKDLSLNWLKERDDLKKQSVELRARIEELDSSVSSKEMKIKELVSFFLLFLPFYPFNLLQN